MDDDDDGGSVARSLRGPGLAVRDVITCSDFFNGPAPPPYLVAAFNGLDRLPINTCELSRIG
jgi:hypothetical protein